MQLQGQKKERVPKLGLNCVAVLASAGRRYVAFLWAVCCLPVCYLSVYHADAILPFSALTYLLQVEHCESKLRQLELASQQLLQVCTDQVLLALQCFAAQKPGWLLAYNSSSDLLGCDIDGLFAHLQRHALPSCC